MEYPVVNVKDGSLRGAKITGVNGVEYFSFLGIPYAAPPIKELRFQDPQPCKPWTGVRDALKDAEQCIQYDMISSQKDGVEDCLYINVSTTCLTGKRSVMVWIHGGGFTFGYSKRDLYSPDYFMKHNIVFVSMNYRLGAIGFLNMGLPDCSGNQGLKDQRAALRWVQQNISVFGGDPDNVTIFGESAGGAAVHALCLSPSSKGLFHKAIAQSGTMYNSWAYKNSNKENGFKLAKDKQPDITNDREVLKLLRNMPIAELIDLQQKYYPMSAQDIHIGFGPTLDSASTEPILPRTLKEDLNTCVDIPMMLGYTSHEGIFFADYRNETLDDNNKRFDKLVARDLLTTNEAKVVEITPSIRRFYFGNRPINNKEYEAFVQYKGDAMIVNGVQYLCDVQMKSKKPTYFYRYSFIADFLTITKMLPRAIPVAGASHADELATLFYPEALQELGKFKENSQSELVKERMLRMWTDFAKYSDPTPKVDDLIPIKWQPISNGTKYFYEIGSEVSLGINPGKKSWDFWKNLDILELSHGSL